MALFMPALKEIGLFIVHEQFPDNEFVLDEETNTLSHSSYWDSIIVVSEGCVISVEFI